MATLPYLRRQLIEKAGRFPNVDRWGAAMLARPAVAEGMTVGVARAETIEGGLDRVHRRAPRDPVGRPPAREAVTSFVIASGAKQSRAVTATPDCRVAFGSSQ